MLNVITITESRILIKDHFAAENRQHEQQSYWEGEWDGWMEWQEKRLKNEAEETKRKKEIDFRHHIND